MLAVADVMQTQPEALGVMVENLRTLSTNDSPVARRAGRRWQKILGRRSAAEVAGLLQRTFGELSPSPRRSELLDLIASTHPFAGILSQEGYQRILREEFSFQ